MTAKLGLVLTIFGTLLFGFVAGSAYEHHSLSENLTVQIERGPHRGFSFGGRCSNISFSGQSYSLCIVTPEDAKQNENMQLETIVIQGDSRTYPVGYCEEHKDECFGGKP